ncbi:hypothetical protein VTK56DRAFT_3522 [Thermocarpiscus australiensis]
MAMYRDEILRMMYVAGEAGLPSVETTTMVENIVRDQVVQVKNKIIVADDLARRRGTAKFTTNDILFQMRHDPARLARLRNFLRWKQVRKKAKVRDDEAADDVDMDEVDDLMEGEAAESAATPDGADGDDGKNLNPDVSKPSAAVSEVSIPPLPWSAISMFPHASDIPGLAASIDDLEGEADNSGDLLLSAKSSSSKPWLLARLIRDDERTRGMTAAEYARWTECRTASFTYRKKKTFRAWCGLGVLADYKSSEDVIEVLGFLCSEWVQTLTEGALAAKETEARALECDLARLRAKAKAGSKRKCPDCEVDMLALMGDVEERGEGESIPAGPIQPRHVRRAFELLQTPPKKSMAMLNGTRLWSKKRLRLTGGPGIAHSVLLEVGSS